MAREQRLEKSNVSLVDGKIAISKREVMQALVDEKERFKRI
jgi:hypothetical protein